MPPDSSRLLLGEPPNPPAPARWFTRGSHAARSPAPEPVTAEKEPDTQPEPAVADRPAHQDESHASPAAASTEQMETNGPSAQIVPAKETTAKRTPAKRAAPRKTTARASSARRSRRPPKGDTSPSAG